MTTARDLCLGALKDAGVLGAGQNASAEDINDALTKLNRMLALWAVRRWLIYYTRDLALPSTGAQSYSIGPGGDINITERPPRIDSAYMRMSAGTSTPIDYPLTQIMSREDYNQIVLKTQPGMPAAYFYDNNFPLAQVFVWPIPDATYELHFNLWLPLTRITALWQQLALPAEYEEAAHYSLCVRLRAAYRLPPDPVFIAAASSALATLRSVNATVPQLQMPGAVLPRGRAAGAPYYPSLPY